MPAWNDLLNELERQPSEVAKAEWIATRLHTALGGIRARRGNRNVIFYASAFLQKPAAPAQLLQLTHEEILFEKGPAARVLLSDAGRQWLKNVWTVTAS